MRFQSLPALVAGCLLVPPAIAQVQWNNLVLYSSATVEIVNGFPRLILFGFDSGVSFAFRRTPPGAPRASLLPTAIFGFDLGCGGTLRLAWRDEDLGLTGQDFPGNGWLWSPQAVQGGAWQRYLSFVDQGFNVLTSFQTTFSAPGGGTTSPCNGHVVPQFVAVCFNLSQY